VSQEGRPPRWALLVFLGLPVALVVAVVVVLAVVATRLTRSVLVGLVVGGLLFAAAACVLPSLLDLYFRLLPSALHRRGQPRGGNATPPSG
jgi:hypothetical protein